MELQRVRHDWATFIPSLWEFPNVPLAFVNNLYFYFASDFSILYWNIKSDYLVYSSNGLGKVLVSFSTMWLRDSVILHATENRVDIGLAHGHVLCAIHFCTAHKPRKVFIFLMKKKKISIFCGTWTFIWNLVFSACK